MGEPTREALTVAGGDGAEYDIRKGDIFYINSVGISRSAKHWIQPFNAKHFATQRIADIDMDTVQFAFWIDGAGKFRHNRALSTFSFGPRECVGKSVAIKNLYVILAALILSYEFSVADTDFEFKPIQKPLLMPDIEPVRITKRK